MKRLIILLVLIAIIGGCISSSKTTPKSTVTVTPCNVVSEGIQIKVVTPTLNPAVVKNPLAEVFVDDLVSTSENQAKLSYTLNCWWAQNIGEEKGLYYCSGAYVAPELDERGTIRRKIKKSFKIGFEVVEHPTEIWVGLDGATHTEPAYYLLTVKTITINCVVA